LIYKNSQVKNIFITGEKGCGKTTLINKFASQSSLICTGFKMKWQFNDNLIKTHLTILPYNENSKFNPSSGELPESNYIAGHWNGFRAVPSCEGFENAGVKILEESLLVSTKNPERYLIIMDELGILEKEAANFKDAVIKALDSEVRVLGVLKKKTSFFSEILSERSDTLIVEINQENREVVDLNNFFK